MGGAAIAKKHRGLVGQPGNATCADAVSLTEQAAVIVLENRPHLWEREIRVVE